MVRWSHVLQSGGTAVRHMDRQHASAQLFSPLERLCRAVSLLAPCWRHLHCTQAGALHMH